MTHEQFCVMVITIMLVVVVLVMGTYYLIREKQIREAKERRQLKREILRHCDNVVFIEDYRF